MYQNLSENNLIKRFYKNASIYGIGAILIKGGHFLFLPYFMVIFSTEDFGILGISQIITNMLMPIIGLGLAGAMQRFFFDWKEQDRKERIFLLWSFSVISAFIICLTIDRFSYFIFPLIISNVEYKPYIQLPLWTTFFASLSLLPLSLLRMQEKLKLYNTICLLNFCTQLLLLLYFISYLNLGILGYLKSQLINSAFWGLLYFIFMIRETKFSTKIYLLKEPIRYAIPLIPTSVLEGVVESLDRLILEKFVGLNHLGIYTLAKQFGSAFNFINNMLKNSWLPLIYRVVCERKDGPQILSRLSLLYSTSMLIPALVIATLSSDFINFFALKKFDLASDLVPFMILAFYWQVLTVSYGRGLDLAKKTNMSFLIPTIAILTNCIVSYYFIPKWGLFGAVFAFNLTLLMKMVTQVSISSYYYPRPFQKLKILIKIGISLATYLLARQINSSNDILDILGKSILLLLSFSSLYFLIVKDSIRQLKPKKTMWLNRQKHQ